MSAQKYRKKPVVIEAIQWKGMNIEEVQDFVGHDLFKVRNASPPSKVEALFIYTLEGNLNVSLGDYIIKGIKGEFYPCKPDIFTETYEIVSLATNEELLQIAKNERQPTYSSARNRLYGKNNSIQISKPNV